MPRLIDRIFQQEDINFLLTNKIPRRALTRLVGWFSRIENPLIRDLSIATWQWFAGDLQLHEARKPAFSSVHDCFIRELKEGARPVDPDPDVLVSPCDAIVGACGTIREGQLLQAKGQTYALDDLVGDASIGERFRGGQYITLRLTSAMYHRFHAPARCTIDQVRYISGDMWNVNPITIRRIAQLYCKNERAVVLVRLESGQELALVAVAAILVASIHLHCATMPLTMNYRGPRRLAAGGVFAKGEELGYFHHGSTIVLIAPGSVERCAHVREGQEVRMGMPLLRVGRLRPAEAVSSDMENTLQGREDCASLT